jgi:hypothetical protein
MHIFSSQSGECYKTIGNFQKIPLIESVQFNRTNYLCVIDNQPEENTAKLTVLNRQYPS